MDSLTNSGSSFQEGVTTGTNYQEVRWRPTTQTTWDWIFATGSGTGGYAVEHEVQNSILGAAFLDTTSHTRDTTSFGSGNSYQRVFTWAWSGHANKQGFSYGQTVAGTDNNSATSFLWENGTENHAMPYTEVYIRRISDAPVPEPATASLALLGLGGLMMRRRRMA